MSGSTYKHEGSRFAFTTEIGVRTTKRTKHTQWKDSLHTVLCNKCFVLSFNHQASAMEYIYNPHSEMKTLGLLDISSRESGQVDSGQVSIIFPITPFLIRNLQRVICSSCIRSVPANSHLDWYMHRGKLSLPKTCFEWKVLRLLKEVFGKQDSTPMKAKFYYSILFGSVPSSKDVCFQEYHCI